MCQCVYIFCTNVHIYRVTTCHDILDSLGKSNNGSTITECQNKACKLGKKGRSSFTGVQGEQCFLNCWHLTNVHSRLGLDRHILDVDTGYNAWHLAISGKFGSHRIFGRTWLISAQLWYMLFSAEHNGTSLGLSSFE